MKILLAPFLIILTPLLVLFFVLRYLGKTKRVSPLMKIALGIVFTSIGIISTYIAVITSISGMSENGVTCMTGAVVFIPFSFLINVIGIPLLLISYKSRFAE